MDGRHAHRRMAAARIRGIIGSRRSLPAAWRSFILVPLAALLAVAASALPAHAGGPVPPDWQQYTVPFLRSFGPDGTGPQAIPPANGNDAAATISLRARSILQQFACGHENEFLGLAMSIGNPATYDGLMNMAVAKLAWLKAGFGDCTGTFNVVHSKGDLSDFLGGLQTNDNPPKPITNLLDFAGLHRNTFLGGCVAEDTISPASSFAGIPSSTTQPFFRIQATVPARCLNTQINWVLSRIQKGNAQPGSNGLPCNISYLVSLSGGPKVFPTTNGDWDMRMKALVRILYLDTLGRGDPPVPPQLQQSVHDHILDDLLVVDGGPGRDSYSWMDCGDNENNTGTPQEREDDNSPSDGFIDSVGDASTWFLKRLLLFAELVTLEGGTGGVGPAVTAILAGLDVVDGGAIIPLGVAAALLGQIPETENHRLMIESTRFLKNELLIAALHGDAPNLRSGQAAVKAWLLDRFHTIATTEFIEYNARPYASFSIEALRNLADFAADPDVSTGAEMLLEYSAAKFAVGSSQGRRLPPFRRHFGVLDCLDGNPCPDETDPNQPPNKTAIEIFRGFQSGTGFGDAEVAYGLLFNGQTQLLPFQNVPEETAGQLVPAATTQVLPTLVPPRGLIADLAIRRNTPYFQQVRHAAYEAYSSSPAALITAGGIQTDHAYKFGPNPPAILVNKAIDLFGFDMQDRGNALPTTVMFTDAAVDPTNQGGGSRMALDHFIQFRGTRQDGEGILDKDEEGLDDNLCVWQNFACGTHIRIPREFLSCLIRPPQAAPPHWFFFDSAAARCGYSAGPAFYLAIYLICENDVCDPLPDNNAGFLEVVDNPTRSFADFQKQVMDGNPPGIVNLGQGCLNGGDCQGHYTTTTDHQLFIALRGHQDDPNKTGILSVDGIAQADLFQLGLAEGFTTFDGGVTFGPPPISSKGDGVITITNPNTRDTVVLNFSDQNHPCRATNGGPCVQP